MLITCKDLYVLCDRYGFINDRSGFKDYSISQGGQIDHDGLVRLLVNPRSMFHNIKYCLLATTTSMIAVAYHPLSRMPIAGGAPMYTQYAYTLAYS